MLNQKSECIWLVSANLQRQLFVTKSAMFVSSAIQHKGRKRQTALLQFAPNPQFARSLGQMERPPLTRALGVLAPAHRSAAWRWCGGAGATSC